MNRGRAHQVLVISVRLILSVAVTILLCYYLPSSLNDNQPRQFFNQQAKELELPLLPPEKPKLPTPKEVQSKPVTASAATPVSSSIPIMPSVADMPLQVPVLAIPTLNGLSLPSIAPVIAGIKDVDKAPELLRFIQPKMPVAGRKFKGGGRVLLRLIVEADGVVSQAQVLEAKPKQVFDQSAVEAARRWRFKPAVLSGEAVRVFVDVPINFKVS
ncbi:TonB family protein [Shewanella halifaxensis HAW-EB4]|uniref:TonB family protein n=1 Tax=Shewanella halifaxensis (strain HAW-EB4) TaxID=458817 RepID=B0TU45_SHEHH|nr:energy transducer TonB [Shewanella halifaxensis]ABZ78156.1 TonB family protein [Shewanella halifaxensis HAW-EB4]